MPKTDFFYRCRKSYVLPHILFWFISISIFIVILFYTRGFQIGDIDLNTAISFIITILLLALSVYINLLWLIPVFFKRRRYIVFYLLEAANILLFIILNFIISTFFEAEEHPHFLTEFIAEFILVSVFLLVSSLLQFTRDSIALQDAELKINEIQKQKIEAELKALKAQVNPHFFFNTLNSLYSLSLDKSDKAPELILTLSELMRYVIYETGENFVSFSRQLEFIQNYIYLEKIRLGDICKVTLNIMGNYTDQKTAPLIFIPFIENAFKHVTKQIEKAPYIFIEFDVRDSKQIRFKVQNNKEDDNPTQGGEGIGLINVKKRLELLYPGKYNLTIKDAGDLYLVNLIIEL